MLYDIEYSKLGFHLIPCHKPNGKGGCSCKSDCGNDCGKHPAIKGGVKQSENSHSFIKKCVSKLETRNIAIVTGEKSGITVVDLDVKPEYNGVDAFNVLCSEHGEVNTLMAKTPTGGLHLFFKYEKRLKNKQNYGIKGLDVRNNNGYVIAAPSKHRNGGLYSWINWGAPLADVPEWLIDILNENKKKAKTDVSKNNPNEYTIDEVREMLEFVSSKDRQEWREIGVILGRTFNCSDEAWNLYAEWAEKGVKTKGKNHDEIMKEAFYEISKEEADNPLTIAHIIHLAVLGGWTSITKLKKEQFAFYAPSNKFVYIQTGTEWAIETIDRVVKWPINQKTETEYRPSTWIAGHRLCTSKTSYPKHDKLIKGKDFHEGGFIDCEGACCYNTYIPPIIDKGDPNKIQPWLDHIKMIFNKEDDYEQFIKYMAHTVQKPYEKKRFALLIAGPMGIGKDTAFEMTIPAIGHWNVSNISPYDLDLPYNEYEASVFIRISEASDLKETNKWAFNERTKTLIAGSPDVVRINPKFGHKYTVMRCHGILLTTNHLLSGIYIPEGDRRYDVIDTATLVEANLDNRDKRKKYFKPFWKWFLNEKGKENIAAFLNEYDIKDFDPDNGQRETESHKNAVASNLTGDEWLADIIEDENKPKAIRSDFILSHFDNIERQKYRPRLTATMERLGYKRLNNNSRTDGKWRIDTKRCVVFVESGKTITVEEIERLPDERKTF